MGALAGCVDEATAHVPALLKETPVALLSFSFPALWIYAPSSHLKRHALVHNQGAEIFAIGVGGAVDDLTLESIASSPENVKRKPARLSSCMPTRPPTTTTCTPHRPPWFSRTL